MNDELQLDGQTVVVIGGSSGIGLATARRARDEGARVIITARDPDRLFRAVGPARAEILSDHRRRGVADAERRKQREQDDAHADRIARERVAAKD